MRGQDSVVEWPEAPPNVPRISSFSGDCLKEEVGASESRGFVSGTFVWTLFDCKHASNLTVAGDSRRKSHRLLAFADWGESGGWPWVTSTYGAFDTAGFEKSTASWFKANWLAAVPEGTPGR